MVSALIRLLNALTLHRLFDVPAGHRGVLLRHGHPVQVLGPGRHRLFDPACAFSVVVSPLQRVPPTNPRPAQATPPGTLRPAAPMDEDVARILDDADAALRDRHVLAIDVPATAVALIRINGVLAHGLRPATRNLYWRDSGDLSVQMIDLTDAPVPVDPALQTELRCTYAMLQSLGTHVVSDEVQEGETGVLIVDGRHVRRLAPGHHSYWRLGQRVHIAILPGPDDPEGGNGDADATDQTGSRSA